MLALPAIPAAVTAILAFVIAVLPSAPADWQAAAPPPPVAITIDPLDPDHVILRWQSEPDATHRLCVARDLARADLIACFAAASESEWVAGIPESDDERFYFTLQACHGVVCSDAVPAGVAGRRVHAGADFYAVATLEPDGHARVAAYSRLPDAAITYHRGIPGLPSLVHTACDPIDIAICTEDYLPLPGAFVGVSQSVAGGGASLSLQLRARPRAYLLFDDGTGLFTNGRYSAQVVLDEYGVKGAFFLTGRAIRDYPGAVRALVAAGHRVGNHTYSHPFLTALSDAQVRSEIEATDQQYRALFPSGTLRPCFRAPNGAIDARIDRIVRGLGYAQINWTVGSLDYSGISAAAVARNVLSGLHDGALISFHTQEISTITALRTIIPTMLAYGYTFHLPC